MGEAMTDRSNALIEQAQSVIEALRREFSPDTALPGSEGEPPSTGHCAVAAIVLHEVLGGEVWSARVEGVSHWFNRLPVDSGFVEVDATADQFGANREWVSTNAPLYPNAKKRSLSEANLETLARAERLANRAGLREVARALHAHRLSRLNVPQA